MATKKAGGFTGPKATFDGLPASNLKLYPNYTPDKIRVDGVLCPVCFAFTGTLIPTKNGKICIMCSSPFCHSKVFSGSPTADSCIRSLVRAMRDNPELAAAIQRAIFAGVKAEVEEALANGDVELARRLTPKIHLPFHRTSAGPLAAIQIPTDVRSVTLPELPPEQPEQPPAPVRRKKL